MLCTCMAALNNTKQDLSITRQTWVTRKKSKFFGHLCRIPEDVQIRLPFFMQEVYKTNVCIHCPEYRPSVAFEERFIN